MKKKTILIIDDEKMIRLTTSIVLEKNGYTVLSASSGANGLKILETETPDIILLDIMMPVMDGWEVAEKIKENEGLKDISIIVFSASEYYDTERRAKALSLKGVMRKPFYIQDLIEIIEK